MIYSDQELRRWWDGLSKQDQAEIFENIEETAKSTFYKQKMRAVKIRWERGEAISVDIIEALRRWDR